MLNHIDLMGRLTKDPELRQTGANIAVASFRIACDRDFGRGENGERQTDFIDVVAWRQTAEFVSKYFTKGSMAIVSGRLQIREWTDKEGQRRTTAEVVADNVYFGDSKRREDNGDSGFGGNYGSRNGGNNYGGSSYGGNSGYGSYNRNDSAPSPFAGASTRNTDPFKEIDDDGELPF